MDSAGQVAQWGSDNYLLIEEFLRCRRLSNGGQSPITSGEVWRGAVGQSINPGWPTQSTIMLSGLIRSPTLYRDKPIPWQHPPPNNPSNVHPKSQGMRGVKRDGHYYVLFGGGCYSEDAMKSFSPVGNVSSMSRAMHARYRTSHPPLLNVTSLPGGWI